MSRWNTPAIWVKQLLGRIVQLEATITFLCSECPTSPKHAHVLRSVELLRRNGVPRTFFKHFKTVSTVILFAGILVIAASAMTRAGAPGIINYQGRVQVAGSDFTGSGLFKFALVSAGGTTTYWSNDGSSSTGTEPTSAISLSVMKGLYSVILGDTSVTNMTTIPASVFNNQDVRLRIWFNDGTNGSQQLNPDQRIAANGYAFVASVADTVVDGGITTAKIVDGAVTTPKLGNNSITSGKIVSLPKCNVYGSSAANISNNATIVPSFDTVRFNTDNMFSLSSPTRIVCNTAGVYHIYASGRIVSGSYINRRTMGIVLNGVTTIIYEYATPNPNDINSSLSTSIDYSLNVGDYIELNFFQDGGGAASLVSVTLGASYVP